VPLLESTYQAPLLLRNGHTHTVYPALKRQVPEVAYVRERLELPDGDFLDLDWSRVGGAKLVMVCHGLEGSSQGAYVRGMVRAFNRRGWDAVALNFRGCSGEPNRLRRFYPSGSSDDLRSGLGRGIQPRRQRDSQAARRVRR
jgi:predicted alpha/beta-fold hydrolase